MRSGYYFDPSTSFSIAIDFDTSLRRSGGRGFGVLGFGINEQQSGGDSFEVTLGFRDILLRDFIATGYANGAVQQRRALNGIGGSSAYETGRFFIEYDSLTRSVVVGASATPGSSTPTATARLQGNQQQPNDTPLIASFFFRAEEEGFRTGILSGRYQTVFSNFEVLSGSPIAVVPEPTTLLATLGALGVLAVLRRR